MRFKRAISVQSIRVTVILLLGLFMTLLGTGNGWADIYLDGVIPASGCPDGAILSTDQFTTTGFSQERTAGPGDVVTAGAWVIADDWVPTTSVIGTPNCPPVGPDGHSLFVVALKVTPTIGSAKDADIEQVELVRDANLDGQYESGIDSVLATKPGSDLDNGGVLFFNGPQSAIFTAGAAPFGVVGVLVVVKIGPHPVSGTTFGLSMEGLAADVPGMNIISSNFASSNSPAGSSIRLNIVGGTAGPGGGTTPPSGGLTLNAHAGWNMISSPVGAVPLSALQGNCSVTSGPWFWNGTSYEQPAQIEPAKGYWVKMANACILQASGANVTQNLQLHSGWNMISASSSWSQIAGGCGLQSGPFWYDGAQYQSVGQNTSLNPFLGYWVKVGAGCSLQGAGVDPGPWAASAMPPPLPDAAVGNISNGTGNIESDAKTITLTNLLTRFRDAQISPGTREAIAIVVGICDGGTLATTSATVLIPTAGASPTIPAGSLPCIPSAATDGFMTGISGATIVFSGPGAPAMQTVRLYVDRPLPGVLFQPAGLVAQVTPKLAPTGEAIAQFGPRQGQILRLASGAPLAVPNASPIPLLLIFTVDIDSNGPSGPVNVAVGVQVGDDSAQGPLGICGGLCRSNLMGTAPELSSFTIAGGAAAPPSPGPGGPPLPPSSGGNLALDQAIDTNHNGKIDDNEIILASNYWATGQAVPGTAGLIITDADMIRLTNEWSTGATIASASLPQPTSLALRALIARQLAGRRLELTAEGQGIVGMEAELFDLAGVRLQQQTTSGSTLTLDLWRADRRPLANGVYLYRVVVFGFDAQKISNGIKKLVVLR